MLWRYTAKGADGSSLVVVNGIVYFTSTNKDQGPYYVSALRASDGAVLWHHASYGYAPVVVNGVTYVTSQDGLVALRARDGALPWRYAPANTGFYGLTLLDGVVYAEAAKYSPASTHTGYRALPIHPGALPCQDDQERALARKSGALAGRAFPPLGGDPV